MRTLETMAALQYMDCSELVCRVLAADGFTDGVKSMATPALIKYFNKKGSGWKSVAVPQAGDIILWDGHTALVESYDASKKREVSVIHATNYKTESGKVVNSVIAEDYRLSYYTKKGAKFYRPIKDKPDGNGFEFSFFDLVEPQDVTNFVNQYYYQQSVDDYTAPHAKTDEFYLEARNFGNRTVNLRFKSIDPNSVL